AGLIGEELGVRPVECLPHYGMPDSSSVAIGCHWLHRDSPRWFLLLTEPDAEIPIIQPHAGANEIVLGGDDHILTPHGLGVCSRSGLIQVGPDAVKLGTAQVGRDSGILDSGDTEWRSLRRDPGLLTRILDTAPGEVLGWFKPRFSYHRSVRIG
ncbi:MAG TPA: hypothetical protein VF729_07620, partial [Solirubrobacterales bacterium]